MGEDTVLTPASGVGQSTAGERWGGLSISV